MRKYLISVFIVLFCSILVGCGKDKFDRVAAFNNYIYIVNPIYTPISKNIKEQTITEQDASSPIVEKVEADEQGRITLYSTSGLDMKFDYSKLEFSYNDTDARINIEGAPITLNSKGYVSNISSDNLNIENIYNNDNEITSYSFSYKNPDQANNDEYSWKNGSISTIVSYTKFLNIGIKTREYFTYDSNGKLIKSESIYSHGPQEKVDADYIITFTEFNEYGDWIKAEKEDKTDEDGTKTTITRDIQYW